MTAKFYLVLLFGVCSLKCSSCSGGILYPRESESREVRDLNGFWKFRAANMSDQEKGFRDNWFLKPLAESGDVILMPVPSSYNDVTQDAGLRDHIGWVWYEREFFVPKHWKRDSSRVNVRFGSANYNTMVWINGVFATAHSGGYLPFQAHVSPLLKFGKVNRITVAVNNTLTPWTIPQGRIVYKNDPAHYPPGYYEQEYNFDFFNYAGIHRPVFLYTTPQTYVDDINITTTVTGQTGTIRYSVSVVGPRKSNKSILLEVYDKQGNLKAQAKGASGEITIANATLWWPRGMSPDPGYLYTLQISLWDNAKNAEGDIYRLPVGVRCLKWDNSSVFINGKPVYFKGFGRHEDSILRGRGVDLVTLAKDFNLMKWTGANSFRTSHYPYAEELMDLADQQGFMVIDEAPAVGLDNFDAPLLEAHLQTLSELIQRDKNRPSVIVWSIGNEPQSQKKESEAYFNHTALHVRHWDPTRPLTVVLNKPSNQDLAAQFVDIICFNRYYGWYSDTGKSELITYQMINEITAWHDRFKKPVLVTEYGAGSIAGLHTDPPVVWTEDYQVELMEQNFKAFDKTRQDGILIGEMIWNFADFATPQEYFRPTGCMKGVFTRERQPKAAAHCLKRRYTQIH